MNQISKEALEKMPKKPMNPYMIFRVEMYPEIKKTNLNQTMTEVSQMIADIWHQMTEKERQVYHLKSQEAHAIYMSKYNDWLTEFNLNQPDVKAYLNNQKKQKKITLLNLKQTKKNKISKQKQSDQEEEDEDEKKIIALKQQISQLRLNQKQQKQNQQEK